MTYNKNTNQQPETLKDQHHKWAKGFRKGGQTVYHPYTRLNFVFPQN
jgi:hypothetical protein